jgi:hypothetical protein
MSAKRKNGMAEQHKRAPSLARYGHASMRRMAGGPPSEFLLADRSARRDHTTSIIWLRVMKLGWGGPFLAALADKGGAFELSHELTET